VDRTSSHLRSSGQTYIAPWRIKPNVRTDHCLGMLSASVCVSTSRGVVGRCTNPSLLETREWHALSTAIFGFGFPDTEVDTLAVFRPDSRSWLVPSSGRWGLSPPNFDQSFALSRGDAVLCLDKRQIWKGKELIKIGAWQQCCRVGKPE